MLTGVTMYPIPCSNCDSICVTEFVTLTRVAEHEFSLKIQYTYIITMVLTRD